MHSVATSERPRGRYFSAPAVKRGWCCGHAALQYAGNGRGRRDERGHGHSAGTCVLARKTYTSVAYLQEPNGKERHHRD